MDIERNVDKRGEPVVSDCCPFLKHAAIEPGMLRSIAGLSEPPFGAIKMARGCGIGVEFLPSSGGTLRASVAADDDGRPVVRVAEGQDAEQSNWIVACALASLALQGPRPVEFHAGTRPNKMLALYAAELLMPQNWVRDAIAAGIVEHEQLATMFGVGVDIVTLRLAMMGYR